MTTSRPTARALAAALALLLSLAAARPARAAIPLITNGGFEAGFSSWTVANQVGSEGTFSLQTGTASPVNALPVPAPPGGTTAAMTDASGPGAHVLYQDFVVPTGQTTGTLTFSLFVGNRADAFFIPTNPATLDFATPALNQQARVDILLATADPFSVATGDVLQNAFQTLATNPLVSGYTTFAVNINALVAARPGQTLRLRFAETDNVSSFQLGVDNVSLLVDVPEPSALTSAGLGLLVLLAQARWRRRPRRAAP